MGVIVGADGGNTKTELVAATVDGELLALVRGPGSNSHAAGGAEAKASHSHPSLTPISIGKIGVKASSAKIDA